MKTLDSLNYGETARVQDIKIKGSMRRRFMDIGLINNTLVECVGVSPAGDPKAFLIRGAVIAIRNNDSSTIIVG